jgi:hypothetical protein
MSRPPAGDLPLLQFTPIDHWTTGDAKRHTLINGDTGSGKTSGSGAALRRAFLQNADAGGLVLVGKPEEAAEWRQACKEAGREKSLIVFDGRNGQALNVLAYEMARQGPDGIGSVVECLLRIVEAARVAGASAGKASDQFWEQSTRMLLRHSLPVIEAGTGEISIPAIIEFVRTAPRTPEEMRDAEWQRRSFFFSAIMAAENRLPRDVGEKIISYWLNEFCVLDPKTRANIVISLTTTLDRFNHGWMQKSFCGATTFVPELCFHGAIILLDLPALTLNEDGIVAQILVKFIWQRAMLTRNALPQKYRDRLCFLWIDEYQLFASSFDPQFLSTCRASNVAVVLLTQSLPTLYASMPGEDARAKVDHLVGMCATKIFHSTSCVTTAKWAADMIGRTLHQRGNYSAGDSTGMSTGLNMSEGENFGGSSGYSSSAGGSVGSDGKTSSNWSHGSNSGTSWGTNANWGRNRGTSTNRTRNAGWSEQMDHAIEPADLGRILRTGGPANGGMVDGIIYQSGRVYQASGTNWLLRCFQQ